MLHTKKVIVLRRSFFWILLRQLRRTGNLHNRILVCGVLEFLPFMVGEMREFCSDLLKNLGRCEIFFLNQIFQERGQFLF